MDDIAYAVTFLRRDPFYAVDLSNPNDIAVLGELDITGFSQYLHPIEGNKLLAVGVETDDEGSRIGLQISLFDAANPVDLTLVNRFVMKDQENSWTDSEVSWEPMAFRYFTVVDMGILIIPLNVYYWGGFVDEPGREEDSKPMEVVRKQGENFEGFVVFTIKDDVITRRFDIDHLDFVNDASSTCDAWCGSLPERSFVIDGNVVTLKSQSVVSTDLATETAEWFLDVRKEVCCA